MARDLERELNAWDGNWPACWRPQAGETLVGRILRYSSGQGRYGPVRTAIVERDDGTRCSLWLSSMVLLDQFRKARPKVGERVGIRYLGKHEKGYHRYTLLVDRPEQEVDFSPLGGELGDGPDTLRTTDRGGPYAAATIKSNGSPDPFEGY